MNDASSAIRTRLHASPPCFGSARGTERSIVAAARSSSRRGSSTLHDAPVDRAPRVHQRPGRARRRRRRPRARGCGRRAARSAPRSSGLARSTSRCCGRASARGARRRARRAKSTGSASPWWFTTPPTLRGSVGTAASCAELGHLGDVGDRQRVGAAADLEGEQPLGARRPARAHDARPRPPVRKRRISAAQLAARARAAPRPTPPSRSIASSWLRARRADLVDRGRVGARDLDRSRPSTRPCARRRAPGCRPPGRSPRRAPRPRRPRRGSARARRAIVFTSSRPSAITLPDCAHLVGDAARVGLDLVDQLRDLVGAARRALGELADLVGDHREAAARLAGARGLDRGVQREQVRARGDARDDLGDLVDVARLRLELEHHAARLLDALEHAAHLLEREARDVDARVRLLVRLGGEAERLARARRVELDGRGDVVDEAARVARAARCCCGAPRATSPTRGRDLLVAAALTPSTLRASSSAECATARSRVPARCATSSRRPSSIAARALSARSSVSSRKAAAARQLDARARGRPADAVGRRERAPGSAARAGARARKPRQRRPPPSATNGRRPTARRRSPSASRARGTRPAAAATRPASPGRTCARGTRARGAYRPRGAPA